MQYQCTYVDIGRAAQHMRQRAAETTDRVLARGFCDAADLLESEARRLQEQAWFGPQNPPDSGGTGAA